MPFSLPPNFVNNVNDIADALRDYEVDIDDKAKDTHLRRALVTACTTLRSIDLVELQNEIERVFQKAEEKNPSWQHEILDTVDDLGRHTHFDFFLNKVEAAVLTALGVNDWASRRILMLLRELRPNPEQRLSITPAGIKERMSKLTEEVCSLSEEWIQRGERAAAEEARQKARKVVNDCFVVSVIAIDVVAPIVYPPITFAGMGTSIMVAGALPV